MGKNKKSDDLTQTYLFWIVFNFIIILFIVAVLFNNFITQSVSWILNLLNFKYVTQLALLIVVVGTNIVIQSMTKNTKILPSGIIAVILYFLLDYIYFAQELTDFSLLNLF